MTLINVWRRPLMPKYWEHQHDEHSAFFICPSFLSAADSDNTWKIAHVPLEVDTKFRYAFQAVRGEPATSTGGIFIDDISLTETRCPNSVWRIQNFSKIMETADASTVIDSPRFYSPEGYAYGVRIRPLSEYTDFTGNYTGLYFQLYSGENDAVMQWPAVNRQATIVVMDQDPEIKHRMSTARSLTTDLRTRKSVFKHFKHNERHFLFDSTQNTRDCPSSSRQRWFVLGQSVQSRHLRQHLWLLQRAVMGLEELCQAFRSQTAELPEKR